MGRSVEHELGAPGLKGLLEAVGVPDVTQLNLQDQFWKLTPKAPLNVPEAVFTPAQKDQARGIELGHLSGQLAADGASCPGDEHDRILQGLVDRVQVEGDGIPPEQVLDGDVAKLLLAAFLAKEALHARQGLHSDILRAEDLGQRPDAGSGGAGDGENHLGGPRFLDDGWKQFGGSQHRYALDPDALLFERIIHKADDPAPHVRVRLQLLTELGPCLPSSDNEGPQCQIIRGRTVPERLSTVGGGTVGPFLQIPMLEIIYGSGSNPHPIQDGEQTATEGDIRMLDAKSDLAIQ